MKPLSIQFERASRMMMLKPPYLWMRVMPSILSIGCQPCSISGPSIATILINCYRDPTDLFIDGDVIHSCEGTTQGDPLGMPMYALATVPLIKKLTTSVTQTWYADDGAATGKIVNLRLWWDEISHLGQVSGIMQMPPRPGLSSRSFERKRTPCLATLK